MSCLFFRRGHSGTWQLNAINGNVDGMKVIRITRRYRLYWKHSTEFHGIDIVRRLCNEIITITIIITIIKKYSSSTAGITIHEADRHPALLANNIVYNSQWRKSNSHSRLFINQWQTGARKKLIYLFYYHH